jgi:hypothetical protein
MARGKALQDPAMLEMALAGYEIEKEKIEEKIKEIQSHLGRRRGVVAVNRKSGARKRILSVAARARIAAAQRRRWAEHRKKAAQAARAARA